MKAAMVLLAVFVFVIMAISLNLPDSGITGFFVKVGSVGLSLAKEVMKTILNFVLQKLG